jgi:hypothetical protein
VWPADVKAQHDPDTGVDGEVLQKVGKASVTVPEGFVRPSSIQPSRLTDDCIYFGIGNSLQDQPACKEQVAESERWEGLGLCHRRGARLWLHDAGRK